MGAPIVGGCRTPFPAELRLLSRGAEAADYRDPELEAVGHHDQAPSQLLSDPPGERQPADVLELILAGVIDQLGKRHQRRPGGNTPFGSLMHLTKKSMMIAPDEDELNWSTVVVFRLFNSGKG